VEAVGFGELVSSEHRQPVENAKPGAGAPGRNRKPAGWVARKRLVFYRVSVIPSAPSSVLGEIISDFRLTTSKTPQHLCTI